MSNDNAQVQPPPAPGSDEYNAAMIARAEAGGVELRVPTDASNPSATAVVKLEAQTPEAKAAAEAAAVAAAAASKPQRPANVPEKFWNADTGAVNTDALLKSYSELEKGKGKPAAPAAPAAPVKSAEQTTAEAELAAAATPEAKAAAQTKLDAANAAAKTAADVAAAAAAKPGTAEVVAKASEEYAEKGEMSEETYAALEAQGLPRDYVDAYVDGMKARAEVIATKVYAEAGGQEQYDVMKAWAAANLSEQEIAAANAAFNSGDINAVLGQVKTLKSAYDTANGKEGRRIEGKGGAEGVTSGNPFRSKEEVTKAMRDPKYKTDRAYRLDVEKRMEAAMKANIDLGF